MAKLSMNKNALHKEREQLRLYERVLPSLDLKRRQLMMEASRARRALPPIQEELDRLNVRIADQLPMLANQEIEVTELVRMEAVHLDEENIVGVKVPVLVDIACAVRDYSMLAKPHWVDVMIDYLKKAAKLYMEVQVATERIRRLEYAVRRTTQRVNLFEKILIPTAQKNIQRIRIFLGDAERAAIVRAKIAKSIQQRQQQLAGNEGI